MRRCLDRSQAIAVILWSHRLAGDPSLSILDIKKFPVTLANAYQRYLDDPNHAWTGSTQQTYETTRALVVTALGADKPVSELSRFDACELVEMLRFLPRNSVKLPNLLARTAASSGSAPRMPMPTLGTSAPSSIGQLVGRSYTAIPHGGFASPTKKLAGTRDTFSRRSS